MICTLCNMIQIHLQTSLCCITWIIGFNKLLYMILSEAKKLSTFLALIRPHTTTPQPQEIPLWYIVGEFTINLVHLDHDDVGGHTSALPHYNEKSPFNPAWQAQLSPTFIIKVSIPDTPHGATKASLAEYFSCTFYTHSNVAMGCTTQFWWSQNADKRV